MEKTATKLTKIKMIDGSYGIVVDDENIKSFHHKKYNFKLRKSDGFFIRYGETKEDDGDMSLGLPEICDMEISTACKQGCAFCYKSNVSKGDNMSFETFKTIFHKLPPTIGQIAFGITDIDANPDMWDIFDYTRSNGIVPNVTINGSRMKPEYFDRLSTTMGAVAVSVYDKDTSYQAVKELTDRGMKQVNIHFMISNETYEGALQLMNDKLTDSRLEKLNAIVLLSLKPKGRAVINNFSKLNQEKFNNLVNFAMDNGIDVGFDSCSCQFFLKSIEGRENQKQLEMFADPCESTIYSTYISCRGEFFPCSFAEGEGEWKEGLSVLDCNDFLEDIWYNNKTLKFRNNAIKCRNCKASCSIYDLDS